MAYQVNKWNGEQLTVLEDGTINTTTDITLVGRNYAGYGEYQNENFLFLLENFAANEPPSKPVTGQIWYDTNTKTLNVYDSSITSAVKWKAIANAQVSETSPANPGKGDLWFKSTTEQLYVYDGTTPFNTNGWSLIGPEAVQGYADTRLVSAKIKGGNNTFYPISKLVVDGTVVAIISKNIFTIDQTEAISGFSEITTGLNISSSANIKGSLIGNASTATKLLTARYINGQLFDGTQNVTIANQNVPFKLKAGTHISGADFDGSAEIFWSVTASSTNQSGRIVVRNANGDFAAGVITAELVGNVTGDIKGDVKATNGTTVLDSGTSGSDATFTGSVTGNVTGNASTSSRLLVSRNINGVPFDGTQDITIVAPVGAGAGLTAGLYIQRSVQPGAPAEYLGTYPETWNIKATAANSGDFIVARDGSGNFAAGTITAALNGNAATATKLQTVRNINGAPFDGTADLTIYDGTKLPLAGGVMSGYLTLSADPVSQMHATTKKYADALIPPINTQIANLQAQINQIISSIQNNTFVSGTTYTISFTNQVGSFNDSANFFDVFPPAGKTMSQLLAFIPSAAEIHFAGGVNADDSFRCKYETLADRVRVRVQNTEQRSRPAANWLAIWSQ